MYRKSDTAMIVRWIPSNKFSFLRIARRGLRWWTCRWRWARRWRRRNRPRRKRPDPPSAACTRLLWRHIRSRTRTARSTSSARALTRRSTWCGSRKRCTAGVTYTRRPRCGSDTQTRMRTCLRRMRRSRRRASRKCCWNTRHRRAGARIACVRRASNIPAGTNTSRRCTRCV